MLNEKIITAANALGFDEYREISSQDIIFSEPVFEACARNDCGNYNQNYTCPPLSGTMAENKARFLAYDHAVILNKIMWLGDYYEKMEESTQSILKLLNALRQELKDLPVMIAGPGGCDLCPDCAAKTKEPCRFPDKKRYSMEGSGMDIVTMSRQAGMTYNGGNKKVGFFIIVMY